LFEKYINILAFEMASPGNHHCVNCIGTLLVPIALQSRPGFLVHVAAVVVVMTLKLQERLTSKEFELHSVNHRLLQLSASLQHVTAVDDVTCRQVCDT